MPGLHLFNGNDIVDDDVDDLEVTDNENIGGDCLIKVFN